MGRIRTADLDAFVAESDARGGPGHPHCDAYWADVTYRPDTIVDETLDPCGEAYTAQQLAVYAEMSGRGFDQHANEHTALEVARHVAAANPYAHPDPAMLSLHVERLSRALRLATPRLGGRMLDMGCGWGLSAEVAAYSGLTVRAVDINPDFVALVNARAARSGLPITAERSGFDEFATDDRFDVVLFYECFHHALRPWTLAATMARHLTAGGHLVLAGEPINAEWWRHWGMRLDPLSVYCIRKFGWLESGWSQPFLERILRDAGLRPRIVPDANGALGDVVLACREPVVRLDPAAILDQWAATGLTMEAGALYGGGSATLQPRLAGGTAVQLRVANYRGRPVDLSLESGGETLLARAIPPGESVVEVAADRIRGTLRWSAEAWSPAAELGNGDTRILSLHLLGAAIV